MHAGLRARGTSRNCNWIGRRAGEDPPNLCLFESRNVSFQEGSPQCQVVRRSDTREHALRGTGWVPVGLPPGFADVPTRTYPVPRNMGLGADPSRLDFIDTAHVKIRKCSPPCGMTLRMDPTRTHRGRREKRYSRGGRGGAVSRSGGVDGAGGAGWRAVRTRPVRHGAGGEGGRAGFG